jgi:hypothetical protein
MRSTLGTGGINKKTMNHNNSFLLPDHAVSGLSAMTSMNPSDIRSSSRLSTNIMNTPSKNVDSAITKGAGIKGVSFPPQNA